MTMVPLFVWQRLTSQVQLAIPRIHGLDADRYRYDLSALGSAFCTLDTLKCVAALEAVRAFRCARPKKLCQGIINTSNILPRLVEALKFPTLVGITPQMLQTPPGAAQEIPTMLHLILKTYKTSIVVYLLKLPDALQADYAGFAAHFVSVFAHGILAIYLHQRISVELYVAGQAWLSKKCQYQIFTFFTETPSHRLLTEAPSSSSPSFSRSSYACTMFEMG
ncbi:hypothetical protein B0H11DRAFT_2189628 [Mycena galericulata]|nr:hypothetical protein B0H11DRAFT_2189628 [Mycena galericulata]